MSTLDCPHANLCGGCPLIALPYAEQLGQKQQQVSALLSAFPELRELEILPTTPAQPSSGYRLRAKLVVDGGSVGLYAAGSHEVVDIPECRVVRPVIAGVAAAVRALLPLPFELLAVDVREVNGGALLTWIVASGTSKALVLEASKRLQAACAEVVAVSWSQRELGSARVLGDSPRTLLGPAWVPHRLASGSPFHPAVAGAFVQAHAGQATALYDGIEAELVRTFGAVSGLHVLELYAGAGGLALQLAARGATVTAVDSFAPALEQLQAAAREQGIRLASRAQSAEAALERAGPVDVAIVDPPRRGLTPEVRRRLAALRPRLLVLVSCEPATLARDLAHLRWLGMVARRIQPFDMIPQSTAVEVLAVLEPTAAAPPFRVVYEDAQLLALDKPAFLPLISQTERSLLGLLRQRPGCENVLPLHPMHPEASGVCLVARDAASAAALATRVAKARAHFQVLARGVTRNGGTLRSRPPARKQPPASVVRYRRLRVVGTHSLLRVELEPGEDRQLGRALAKLSHPVLGDAASGDSPSNRFFAEKHGLDRAFLHCERIELPDLGSGLAAELAPELRHVLASLQSTASTRFPLSSMQGSRAALPEVSQPHESRAR